MSTYEPVPMAAARLYRIVHCHRAGGRGSAGMRSSVEGLVVMSAGAWRFRRWVGRDGSWRPAYAVRREWPDGTHDIFGFRATEASAWRLLHRDQNFWRRGPVRPVSRAVVVTSRRDVRVHGRRYGCRAPDCPTALASAVVLLGRAA